jgi:hypothetical protein
MKAVFSWMVLMGVNFFEGSVWGSISADVEG